MPFIARIMSDNKSQKADEQKGKRNERKAADLYEKGRQFMCMGNPQAAFECYTRSLQVRPTEKVFISRAVLNVEMKRLSTFYLSNRTYFRVNCALKGG